MYLLRSWPPKISSRTTVVLCSAYAVYLSGTKFGCVITTYLTPVQVSNITDRNYLGTHQTLTLLSPLLQSPTKNPHATLISLYLNGLIEIINSGDEEGQALNIQLMLKYVTVKIENMMNSQQGADYYKLWDSRHFGLDAEKREEYFQT